MTMELAEIPQVKLAKVGRDEREKERKKAGLAWWLRGGRTASDLARGGAGSASGWLRALARFLQTIGLGNVPLASLLGKALVALLLGAGCVGAYNFGQTLSGDDANAKNQAAKPFASRLDGGGSSDGVGSAGAAQSGLGMISGSLTDPIDQAAADKAAADKAASDGVKEAPDAQAAGNADAAGADGAGAGKGHAAFGQKFGQLSSGLGSGRSGLAGGAGMSAGVGRSFDKMGMAKPIGKAAAPTRGKGAQAIRGRRGKAFNQLKGANASSRQGAGATTAETATAAADSGFSNNRPIGSLITSPVDTPLGANTGGTGAGTTNPNPNPTPGTETPNPGTTSVPDTGHDDVTPWKGKMKMAAMLLALGMVLVLVAGFWGDSAKIPIYGTFALTIAQIIAGIAAMIGLAVVAIGASIAKHGGGGSSVGHMFEAAGGVLAAGAAAVAFMGSSQSKILNMSTTGVIALATTAISGLLAYKGYSMGAKLN
jgi:hypothetical protein